MPPQILNTQNADAIRRQLITGTTSRLDQFHGVTLAGAMELFATAVAVPRSADLLDQIYAATGERNQLWLPLNRAWERPADSDFDKDVFGNRTIEFYRLRTIDDQISGSFMVFQRRFVRNLTRNSFPSQFALGLSKVFTEMTDNVIQHSELPGREFTGLAGYHIAPNYVSFAVSDIGRGALACLRNSPAWHHLLKASDALHAIVRDSASSRAGQGQGEGFRQLFRTLVDRNVSIRLRTDDAALLISDTTATRQAASIISPTLVGLQVAVVCALDRPAAEEPINPR